MFSARPIVVDLDGTLIKTDMLYESILSLLKANIFAVLKVPFWLLKGKAFMKREVSSRVAFAPDVLPYNHDLLIWLKEQKSEGRKLVLCSSSDQKIAQSIASHLGIFDEVIGSDGVKNLSVENRVQILEQRYGKNAFDYAGNSQADCVVWEKANAAIVVNGNKKLQDKAKLTYNTEQIFSEAKNKKSVFLRMLRVHQWLKNVLIFVPLLAAHEIANLGAWITLFFAFLAFSLCASAVYIANDLLDLDSDRHHPRKNKRPFASGDLPIWVGLAVAPILLLGSLITGYFAGNAFLVSLVSYFAITCAYSLFLKRLMLVDCLTLAALYTLRVIAGAVALGQVLSFWLLAFSVFLFLSLAFLKRYAELELQQLSGKLKVHGRGYHTSDASIIQSMGIVSGYTATLVLAFYLNSAEVIKLYREPALIWGAIPMLVYWLSWMWMQAHRGKMHDDPLVFAAKEPISLVSFGLMALFMVAGAFGIPQ